jgi:chromatin segregation and condensation protein Rec8/ScpA/Scc1 (kleisin family)
MLRQADAEGAFPCTAVGSTFMAALELARGAELALDQDAAFQGIVVTPLAALPVAAQAHE